MCKRCLDTNIEAPSQHSWQRRDEAIFLLLVPTQTFLPPHLTSMIVPFHFARLIQPDQSHNHHVAGMSKQWEDIFRSDLGISRCHRGRSSLGRAQPTKKSGFVFRPNSGPIVCYGPPSSTPPGRTPLPSNSVHQFDRHPADVQASVQPPMPPTRRSAPAAAGASRALLPTQLSHPS